MQVRLLRLIGTVLTYLVKTLRFNHYIMLYQIQNNLITAIKTRHFETQQIARLAS